MRLAVAPGIPFYYIQRICSIYDLCIRCEKSSNTVLPPFVRMLAVQFDQFWPWLDFNSFSFYLRIDPEINEVYMDVPYVLRIYIAESSAS